MCYIVPLIKIDFIPKPIYKLNWMQNQLKKNYHIIKT